MPSDIDPATLTPEAAQRMGTGWRERAYLLGVVGETGGAIRAARAGMRATRGTEHDEMRAILLKALCAAGRLDEAAALHAELVAELSSAGRCGEAALEERVGLALYGSTSEFALEALEMEVLRLADAAIPAVVSARVRTALARERIRVGAPDGVRDLLDAALAVVKPCEARHAFADAMLLRIRFERESGKFGAAVAFIERLLASEPDRGTRLRALLERARVHAFWGEIVEGARLINEAESLALEIVGQMRPGGRGR
jgi:hypothetical protein